MLIDCDDCAMRDIACRECVVTVLLDGPRAAGSGPDGGTGPATGLVDIDETEQRALEVLAAEGLVPRLRLVPLVAPTRRPQTRAG